MYCTLNINDWCGGFRTPHGTLVHNLLIWDDYRGREETRNCPTLYSYDLTVI